VITHAKLCRKSGKLLKLRMQQKHRKSMMHGEGGTSDQHTINQQNTDVYADTNTKHIQLLSYEYVCSYTARLCLIYDSCSVR
jgi:hypothetical protein